MLFALTVYKSLFCFGIVRNCECRILLHKLVKTAYNLFFITLCLRFNRHRQNRLRKFNTGKYDILTLFT